MKGQRYILKGHCNMCGVCCLREGKDGGECEHLLEKDEEGRRLCALKHSPDRPQKCGAFPGNPPIQFKECSFYFIDLWDNNRIVKPGEV